MLGNSIFNIICTKGMYQSKITYSKIHIFGNSLLTIKISLTMNLQVIQNKIYEIREQQVMLDFDLAALYQVETKRLKEQVKRNIERFPEDFMFILTENEWNELVANCDQLPKTIKHSYIMPSVFTQEGVAMLSSVLRSPIAIQVNINIMRAFVRMRNCLVANCNKLPSDKKLTELEQQVKYLQEDIESLSKDHENYEQHFDDIYLALAELAAKNKEKPANPRPKIGYVK